MSSFRKCVEEQLSYMLNKNFQYIDYDKLNDRIIFIRDNNLIDFSNEKELFIKFPIYSYEVYELEGLDLTNFLNEICRKTLSHEAIKHYLDNNQKIYYSNNTFEISLHYRVMDLKITFLKEKEG